MPSKKTSGISPTTGQEFSIEETAPQDSVEISSTAAGKVTISVKAYDLDTDTAASRAHFTFMALVSKLEKEGVHILQK